MLKGFTCTRCGECCKISPSLSSADIHRIKKLGYPEEQFVDIAPNGEAYMQMKRGWCVFLRKNKEIYSCKIYGHHPKICRQYPIRLINGSCKPEILSSDQLFTTWKNNH